MREIGAAVGLKSPSTVHFHMKGLEEAGVIVKAEGKTRAITIPAMPLGAVAEETDPQENQIPILGTVAAGAGTPGCCLKTRTMTPSTATTPTSSARWWRWSGGIKVPAETGPVPRAPQKRRG